MNAARTAALANPAHARAAASLAATRARPIAKGDVVHVLPGYSMDTRQRTQIDAWTDTTMYVVRVCSNGDYLLDYDADGEGEVYVNEGRLDRI
jgi:hypothetical protein